MSLELTLLGTGTPTPLVHRAGSSYLVTLDDEVLLFDCGPFCVRRLLEKGVSPTRVSTLFLTHLHYDHCVDYGYLTLVRWDQGAGQIADLQVYGPQGTARMTELLFGEEGVYGPDLAARTIHPGSHIVYEVRGGVLPRKRPESVVQEVEHGGVVKSDQWSVTVAEVIHVQPQLTCLAYRLEAQGHSIVFGGDTAPVESLTELARGADVLLHMCHFVSGVVTDTRMTSCCSGHLDAARTARDAEVGTLVLVHLTEQVERPGTRERVLVEAGQIFDGQIIFAEDLLEVPIGTIEVEKIQ
jgi:ribonuclease Z